jgi:uncharacterized protein YgbK (DUF1537 family)
VSTAPVARGRDWDAGLPPARSVPPARIASALAEARRVVVLDDDPTGTQTVRDVPVLTRWQDDDVAWALAQGGAGFFVLTNTRSLPPEAAAARTREIAATCLRVAGAQGIDLAFVSRGDSTLRGHFPLETDVLRDVEREHGRAVDAVLLSPAYLDAGRVTLDGTHWLRGPDGLLPVGESEFARDATFGFRASRLDAWVEEKSAGLVRAEQVRSIPLADLRTDGAALAAALAAAGDGAVVVIDAVTDDDLRAAVLAVLDAERAGVRIVYRAGPSFVRARLGQGAHPPTSDDELRDLGMGARHGLVAVGSHVGITSRQLERLRTDHRHRALELEVDRVLEGDAESAIAPVAREAAATLDDRLVILSTSRALRTGATAQESLEVSRRVSAALTETVRRVVAERRPAYVLAKGGITSSDIATDALGIARARVRGSMLDGIGSLWQAVSGPSAGLPYVVFAGNVGDDASLSAVVARLEAARTEGMSA